MIRSIDTHTLSSSINPMDASSKRTNTTAAVAAGSRGRNPAYLTHAFVHQDKAWANSIHRFWSGDDEYRNHTFKLFPRLTKSNWAIQAAVGKKPALIGNKKLELTYIRGPGYLEIDIDISSSAIATQILGMVSKSFLSNNFQSVIYCN